MGRDGFVKRRKKKTFTRGSTIKESIKGELCFGGRWAPKLTKGPYNSSN